MDSKELITKLIQGINKKALSRINIMEVCGTHTQAISRFGIRNLLSSNINLISGPGCPVCVTEEGYIDACIDILERNDVILATFGDMVRVKGTEKSLLDIRAQGKKVIVVYSPLDVLKLAHLNTNKIIVLFGVGFETTSPALAMTIKLAEEKGLENLYFLLSLKRMDPILRKIFNNKHFIDGLICPGHVATIMGSEYFRFIARDYGVPAVICGFEALDIIGGIYFIVKSLENKLNKRFANLYQRCVTEEGNETAKRVMNQVFKISDCYWRGIGLIENSSLVLNDRYSKYDALKRFNIEIYRNKVNRKCECSDIILGNKSPNQCKLFGSKCTPDNPRGPCMVSSEGSCSIYYKYNRRI